MPDYIPIVFHNLSGCNAHLFKKVARKKNAEDNIGVSRKQGEIY